MFGRTKAEPSQTPYNVQTEAPQMWREDIGGLFHALVSGRFLDPLRKLWTASELAWTRLFAPTTNLAQMQPGPNTNLSSTGEGNKTTVPCKVLFLPVWAAQSRSAAGPSVSGLENNSSELLMSLLSNKVTRFTPPVACRWFFLIHFSHFAKEQQLDGNDGRGRSVSKSLKLHD